MKIKISFIFVFLTITFILLIFFKSLFENKNYIPKKTSKIENISIEEFYSGKNLKIKDFFENEKYLIINIWSSWCVPCRQEHPILTNLNLENKLNIIGMNYKDNLKNAENFLNELGNPYKEIFIDLDGTIAIEWGAYGVPESFLIYNNEIIKKYIGPLNQELVDEINLLIK